MRGARHKIKDARRKTCVGWRWKYHEGRKVKDTRRKTGVGWRWNSINNLGVLHFRPFRFVTKDDEQNAERCGDEE